MMAVSSALSRSAFECSLNGSSSLRPFLAALPGHGQQCFPLKMVKMVLDNKENGGRAKVTLARAHRTRTVVTAAAVKEGVAVDVNAPPSVLVDTLLSLVCPSFSCTIPGRMCANVAYSRS